MIPHALTLANLSCGLLAIVSGMHGSPLRSVWLILAAMVFDGLDGTVARLMKRDGVFGAYLDAQADLVSFGVAPVILLEAVSTASPSWFQRFAGLLFASCGALRLARYCTTPTQARRMFEGLPIPSAAGLLLILALASLERSSFTQSPLVVLVMLLASGLMVSKVPYPRLTVLMRNGWWTVGIAGAAAGGILWACGHRALALTPVFCGYAVFAPLSAVGRSRTRATLAGSRRHEPSR